MNKNELTSDELHNLEVFNNIVGFESIIYRYNDLLLKIFEEKNEKVLFNKLKKTEILEI